VQPHGVQQLCGGEHIHDGRPGWIRKRSAHRAHGKLLKQYLRREPPVAALPAQHALLRRVAEPDEAARKARMPPKIPINGLPEEVHHIHK
jgi:hypothetical protein